MCSPGRPDKERCILAMVAMVVVTAAVESRGILAAAGIAAVQ